MKTGQLSINPARAIALAAFLAFPMHSLAQSNASPFGGRAQKPVCAYKGVMSDAEVELCTGYRVHYNYAIDSGRAAAGASAGGAYYARTGAVGMAPSAPGLIVQSTVPLRAGVGRVDSVASALNPDGTWAGFDRLGLQMQDGSTQIVDTRGPHYQIGEFVEITGDSQIRE